MSMTTLSVRLSEKDQQALDRLIEERRRALAFEGAEHVGAAYVIRWLIRQAAGAVASEVAAACRVPGCALEMPHGHAPNSDAFLPEELRQKRARR